MLNPIEKFKVVILHLNRDWNHRHWYPGILLYTLGGTPNSQPFVHLVLVRNLLLKHRKTAAFLIDTFYKIQT